MIRIAIGQAAFDAIASTIPIGSVGYEGQTNEKGERLIWLDPGVVDRLRSPARAGRDLQRCYPAAGGGNACSLRSRGH